MKGKHSKRRLDLSEEIGTIELVILEDIISKMRRSAIEQITLANSGHPGAALGFAEMNLAIYYGSNINPKDPYAPGSDIVINSTGHYSASDYATLALLRFFPEDDLAHFRKAGSRYEGHVSHKVPGVWLDTGILGQGLSAATGFSIANKLLGHDDVNITAKMGDGEQN